MSLNNKINSRLMLIHYVNQTLIVPITQNVLRINAFVKMALMLEDQFVLT